MYSRLMNYFFQFTSQIIKILSDERCFKYIEIHLKLNGFLFLVFTSMNWTILVFW